MMFPIDYNGDVLNHNARVVVDGGIVESTDFLADFSEQTKRVNMPLLLDIYPNAAAAYSLRKLRTAYTGAAIRVRRSSDNTETDIGFNNAGDLDTSALATFVGNGNGFVSTWYDQSGSGNNVIQTSTTSQPVVVSGGTIIVNNGRNSLRFDGLNDFLSINKSLFDTRDIALITIYSSLNTSAFQYIVGQGGDANTGAWGIGSSTNTSGIYYGFIQTSFGRLAFAGAGTDSVNGSTKVFTQLFLRNSNRLAYVNNNLIATTDISAYNQTLSGSTDPFYIGTYAKANQGFFNGHLNEVLIYNTNQSPNRIGIETNINSYYRIYQQEALLLDYYPDAAAAYSLRKLRSGYTGAAIQVRRSSDNAVQNIGFDSNGGLDTTALTTFVGTENTGFVTTWYDQSLNGNNATSTGTTQQPVIFSGGTIISENNKPSLRFDGVNTYLNSNNVASYFTGVDKFLTASTVLKGNQLTPISNQTAWGFGNSSTATPTRWFGQSSGTTQMRLDERDDLGVITNTIGGDLSKNSLGFLISNADSKNLFSNSVNVDSDTGTLDQITLNKFSIGCLDRTSRIIFLNGQIQEIILWASNQSPNRIGIEANINSYYNIYVSENDAQSFIDAAAITNSTQRQAINKLVYDLKAYGLWYKMKAIYPFVGGTAASHKFNLKDPRDVDGAFRLQFFGGWTHSSSGATSDGTTGYANTYLNPDTALSLNTVHNGFYLRTNNQNINGCAIPQAGYLLVQFISGNTMSSHLNTLAADSFSTNLTPSGFLVANRTSSTVVNGWRNGSKLSTDSKTTFSKPTVDYYIGARNFLGGPVFSTSTGVNQYAFATIGDGLTDTEAANLYTAVQTFQTTLGRQV